MYGEQSAGAEEIIDSILPTIHHRYNLFTNRKDIMLLFFQLFLLDFLTLKDKYNICTLSENIKFICTCCETPIKLQHERTILMGEGLR